MNFVVGIWANSLNCSEITKETKPQNPSLQVEAENSFELTVEDPDKVRLVFSSASQNFTFYSNVERSRCNLKGSLRCAGFVERFTGAGALSEN